MLKLSLEKDSFADTPPDLIRVNTCALCPTKTLIAIATGAGEKPDEDIPKVKIYRFNREEWKLIREEKVPQGADGGKKGGQSVGKQRPLTSIDLKRNMLILQRLQKKGNGKPAQQPGANASSAAAGSSSAKKANAVVATSLAWRPDGLVLACGHSNGTCNIYSPERSETWTPSDTGSKEPIVSMFWSLGPLEEHKRVTLFQNEGIERFFSRDESSSSYCVSDCAQGRKSRNQDKEKGFPFAWDSLDLLFTLDKKWNVYIFSCGQFLVGKINCGAILGPEVGSVTPTHVQYSADLRYGIVLGHRTADCADVKTGPKTKFPSIDVITVSLENLAKKKMIVSNVSRSMWGVNTEAAKVHAIVGKCASSWKKVNELFMQRKAKLEELLEEHGSNRSPEEDLLAFLAAGELSPAMEQFIPTDIRTFHDGIEKGLWSILNTLRFTLPKLLEQFYLFVLEAQKGEQSARFAKLDEPIKELGEKVRSLTKTIMPRDISDGLARNMDRAQEKWPDTNETRFIAESIKYRLDTADNASLEWINLFNATASLLALTKETMMSSILGDVADISDMDSYILETPSQLPEEVRTCCSPPIILLGDTANYMYKQSETDAANADASNLMLLDDDDDDNDDDDDGYYRSNVMKEPESLDDFLVSTKIPRAREVIASWSQKKVRTEWGEGKIDFGSLGTGARVIDFTFIWDGNLVVLYTFGELKTFMGVLGRGKDNAWRLIPENTVKVPDDAKRVICDEESGRVIVTCASERTQIYTTKQEVYY